MSYKYDQPTPEQVIAAPAFNMGSDYLTRCSYISDKIADYSIRGKYELLYNSLLALFREISPYLTSPEQKKVETRIKDIVKHYSLQKEYTLNGEKSKGSGNKDIRKVWMLKASKEWKAFTISLHNLNMELKSHVHRTGLLMPSKKDRTIMGGTE